MLYLWGLSISIGSFLMGYFLVIVTVLSSSLVAYNTKDGEEYNMSFLLSICTTALPLGALIGALMYNRITNLIGSENKLIVYLHVFAIVSLALQLISLDIYVYSVIRLVQGFITGLSGIVVSQYLMSISPTKISGLMGSFGQIMITVGIAAAFTFGYLIDAKDLKNPYNWRLCVSFPIPLCFITILTCKYLSFDSIERHIRNRDWKTLFEYIDMFYIRDSMSLETLVQSKNIDAAKIPGGVPKDRQSASFAKI
jgi:MFS family permease